MKVYLAGKMSGIPQYNIPKFIEVAAVLRSMGHEVVSPNELDDPEVTAKCLADMTGYADTGHSWGEYLARDVKIVADDVEAVVVLGDWKDSRGARLEAFVARLCDKPVYQFHEATKHAPAKIKLIQGVDVRMGCAYGNQ
jgi:hypothetical protein